MGSVSKQAFPAGTTAAVITVSDRCSAGTFHDLSGPEIAGLLVDHGVANVDRGLVVDDVEAIQAALREFAPRVRLIVTTGGTGLAPRDVTPEATTQICDRLVPGLSEVMRAEGLKQTPLAALSRGVCGTLGTTLILNLPGSPAGARSSLLAVMHLLPHALDVLAGTPAHAEPPAHLQ